MGSEQSHHQAGISRDLSRIQPGTARLQRGNTIAVSELTKRLQEDASLHGADARPVSPPISVCSDSDLPYVSYIDCPIGDSPKMRSKGKIVSRNTRSNSISATSARKPVMKPKQRPTSTHTIVIVKSALKEPGVERDPDILRLQNIPMFLPVMRGTQSTHSSRDPEVLERLPPAHLQNICSRMQNHYYMCASEVATDQNQIMTKIKKVDYAINKLFMAYIEKQKTYTAYIEQFSKIRIISQQLTRCTALLNQNIESLETLNNFLDGENRLEPFVWKMG